MQVTVENLGITQGVLDTALFAKPVFLDEQCTIPAPATIRIKNGYLWHNGNIVELYAKD